MNKNEKIEVMGRRKCVLAEYPTSSSHDPPGIWVWHISYYKYEQNKRCQDSQSQYGDNTPSPGVEI